MKRENLKSKIIPTTIENTDATNKKTDESFNTTDLIYLDNYSERNRDRTVLYIEPIAGEPIYESEDISATDYAIMNGAIVSNVSTSRIGRQSTITWLRPEQKQYMSIDTTDIGTGIGHVNNEGTQYGICPSLHYQLPSNNSEQESEIDIREVKDSEGKTIYHTLQIGEYPKTKVDENLSNILEELYNGGDIKEEILCTGRWYSGNGRELMSYHGTYIGKHNPEFEYQGDRYVRVASNTCTEERRYSDGTPFGKRGAIRWVKVEPISFIIKNWDEMPQTINPNGNGKAKFFDLRAEEAISANIPSFKANDDQNSIMWQNSLARGFLNGINTRNIQSNGNIEYNSVFGGNFTSECNFLNEAFNLSREPITEYTIPDSETSIPDDAFNGCITLKKLVIHPGIDFAGERSFEGINFKYAYRTKKDELVFSYELPKDKNEYKNLIMIDELRKSFYGFDYGILLEANEEQINELVQISRSLNKNKFRIPLMFAAFLIESGQTKQFCENSVFKFFKSEIPNIEEMLLNFSDEEKIDFFRFAYSLGCFSTNKIVDSQKKETEVSVAQKASSTLAIMLKKDEMKIRKIS